jgi:hypothetical protein
VAQLFLDCDGVLADFVSAAVDLFGREPRLVEGELGSEEFDRRLREHGSFYRDLPLMTDAQILFEAVSHLNPIILTGCPAGQWAEPQKVAWAAQHFPNVRMITCRSRDKSLHMTRGDILIDDYLKYKHLWEKAGGIFIHHISARESINQLTALDGVVRLSPAVVKFDRCAKTRKG